MDSGSFPGSIVILYTTKYREGGDKFAQVATTLEQEKRREFPGRTIICKAVESKAEFKREVEGPLISELHFIGHSGLYGIMFGTTKWPEQFSPFEWTQMKIQFAPSAEAYFHACRTGRWFAPFFARTFQVRSHGYFWYTSVSTSKSRFGWEGLRAGQKPVHIVSVAGRKSHGLFGSLAKYLLRPATYPFLSFEPTNEKVDTTYDSVAELYDDTFEDISVRSDELRWLRKKLEAIHPRSLLDIGCGTGAFLRGIGDLVESADGVDLSGKMIEQARSRKSPHASRLNFTKIDGHELPFADNSFDVVTSVLSFRYLDWDPIVNEIARVLKPGGHLIVIDMVAAPLSFKHWPRFLIDKVRQKLTLLKNPHYRAALKKMVTHESWRKMLAYNPMRAEHEYRWYLGSRFPDSELDVINYAWNSRILAFKSSPIFQKDIAKQSYP